MLHLFLRSNMFKKKNRIVEKHKFKVIGPIEEIYPETKQKLIRPRIDYVRVIVIVLSVILLLGVFDWCILKMLSCASWFAKMELSDQQSFIILYIILLALCILFCAKRIVIFLIRLYQRYGSYEIRSMCLFIPNCSEYMVLAIKKYGLIKGIKKGIKRFNRCCDPNGGIDYP